MRLRHNAKVYIAGGLIAMLVPGIALLDSVQREGPARLLLLIIAAGVFAILASAFVWAVVLTRVEVIDRAIVVTTPLKKKSWRFPEDITSIVDDGSVYQIRFTGAAGVYKFSSGIFRRDGALVPLDELVSRARTQNRNA